jgi:hypothetical protein
MDNQLSISPSYKKAPTLLQLLAYLALMKHLLLLALLLLPVLAQADPLNNGALRVLGLVVLCLLGLFGTTLGLTFWAYFRPTARVLFWVQLLLLGGCLWLGVLQERYARGALPLLGDYNPLLQVCVPLGVWLNGVTLARSANRVGVRLFWVSVAVSALLHLLTLLPYAWLNSYSRHFILPTQSPGLWQAAYLLLALVAGICSWWVVLRQVASPSVPQPSLWLPWWRPPAVGALVGIGYFAIHMSFVLGPHAGIVLGMPWLQLLQAALKGAVVNWIAGVIALRLTRPIAADGQ